MSNRDDGGQVFPVQFISQNQSTGETTMHQSEPGLTLRDYFIAHAPVRPQGWFDPVMPPKPEIPQPPSDLTEEEKLELDGLHDWLDEEDIEHPRVLAFLAARKQANEALFKWRQDYDKQHCIQWPAAWADAMLKARA